jgi:signal peptide peptidase SppA
MTKLIHLADRVLNRPLLIHPDKAAVILAVIEGRIGVLASEFTDGASDRLAALMPPLEASRFVGEEQRGGYSRTAAGAAIITVTGSLVSRGAWVGANSGLTSYEGIKAQLDAALADAKVSTIVLDVHSPGGEVIGAFELGDAVRAAAAVKPVVAVANGMMASAAYAIAAGATRIVASPSSVVGSIGVVMMHADYSKKLDKDGVTVTLLHAGAHKVDGNPFEPLTDQVKADLQGEINAIYDQFVASVASGRRGMSPAAIRGTEARVFIGAKAVDVGLADSVGTFDSVLAELTRGSSGRAIPSTLKGSTMTDTNTGAATAAATPPGITAGERDAAVTAAVTAERARMAGLTALGAKLPGHDAIITAAVAEGISVEAAALRIVDAEAAIRTRAATGLKDADALVRGASSAPRVDTGRADHAASAAAAGGAPSIEGKSDDQLKADWQASTALRQEFLTAADYVGFAKAETAGKVRILRGRDQKAA